MRFLLKSILGLFLSVFFLFLLSGCSLFAPANPSPRQKYLLNNNFNYINHNIYIHHNNTQKILLVSPITSTPWLNTAEMAYQLQSDQINYFAKNQWADSPSQLLQPIVVNALEKSHSYRAVIAAPFYGKYDQRLDIHILNFQQVFTQKPSIYKITFRIRLINQATQKIIRTRLFNLTAPTPSDNPEGGVIAANQLITQWMPELIGFVNAKNNP